jgi:hypothetical protein
MITGPIEEQIAQWRSYVRKRPALDGQDVEELEGHLRDQLAALVETGLTEEEAFLVAVKRMGSLDALSREFAREHSDRLWKQLVLTPEAAEATAATSRTETLVVLCLALAAALAVKAPALFGQPMDDGNEHFYLRNASFFALPLLTVYLLWKRRTNLKRGLWLALPFLAGAVFANVYPFEKSGDTWVLTTLHLPIALWLVVGFAYVRGPWFHDPGRMDFLRFSGELFIYFVLIALGGGVFTAVTVNMFRAIGMNAEWLASHWLVPCGAAGAVLVASWLVEAKQSVIESMAPVLTKLFTPLFTLLLLVFLGTMAWTGNPIKMDRDLLIIFDLLLVLVLALVLYALSSRDPHAPPGFFDAMQLLLVVSALLANGLALSAMAARISEFGFTPNRTAALGENLILFVNLSWSAWLYAQFLRRRTPFAALERWQLAYLPVHSLWAAAVVVLFPPLFNYR